MPVRPAASVAPRSILCLVIVAALPAAGEDPPAEDIAVEAAGVFAKLDAAPHDGVLAGSEMETVPGYDGDGDGRVTPEEFVRGYLVRKPAFRWQRQEFAREGFSCEMPGPPEPLDADGAAHFQVAVSVVEPKALLVARTRDMPARAAGKAEPFFDTVVEQLEESGARVVGRQAADLGLHRGSMVAAKREDDTLEVVRSVVVGRTVYELHAILSPEAGEAGRTMAARFLGSLQLAR